MADNTMSDKTIENLHVLTMTNEFQMDGHHLIEKKQRKNQIIPEFVVERVHIRSIDGKSYKLTETISPVTEVPEVETDMTEDEVKKFKEDWKNYLRRFQDFPGYIENLHVLTMTNELEIDGHHLVEKNQEKHQIIHTNVSSKNVVERVHIRSIDGKSYKVTETQIWTEVSDVETETDMTEDEVKKFNEDWKNLWNQNLDELNFALDI